MTFIDYTAHGLAFCKRCFVASGCLFVASWFLLFTVVFASEEPFIEKEDRAQYSDIVREMCHSAADYNLDDPWLALGAQKGVKAQYDERMACFFESAFVTATNEMNKSFSEQFFNKIFMPAIPYTVYKPKDLTLPASCENSSFTLQATITAQQNNGYKTLCVVDGRDSTVERPYSSCHVAEAAWNEFCSYQEYLFWKQQDGTLLQEFRARGGRIVVDWTEYWRNTIRDHSEERDQAERLLTDTLETYLTYERDYRLNLWQKVIEQGLIVTRAKLQLIRTAVEKWPAKFHNATIE